MSDHTHVHGLQFDLQALERRRLLGLMLGGGMLVAGGTGLASRARAADGGQAGEICAIPDTETNGPFPADGSNYAGRSLSNVLTDSGVVRRDIRTSFGAAKGVAEGARLSFTIRLGDAGAVCKPRVGHAVYIWQCSRDGQYSIYQNAETYLRGVQITDQKGEVTFETIVPGCYPGRYPHIHIEVYPSLTASTQFRQAILTSQFALPRETCAALYAADPAYGNSARNLTRITTANDTEFRNNTPAQMAVQMMKLTGDAKTGFKATSAVGLRAV